jgi:hypothetical protein
MASDSAVIRFFFFFGAPGVTLAAGDAVEEGLASGDGDLAAP